MQKRGQQHIMNSKRQKVLKRRGAPDDGCFVVDAAGVEVVSVGIMVVGMMVLLTGGAGTAVGATDDTMDGADVDVMVVGNPVGHDGAGTGTSPTSVPS
jgi:hypothetical protein